MRYLFFLSIILVSITNVNGQEVKLLTLDSAIQIGLDNNPAIKVAQENIIAESGRYLTGISLPQPEITYDNQWIPSNPKNGEERVKNHFQSLNHLNSLLITF